MDGLDPMTASHCAWVTGVRPRKNPSTRTVRGGTSLSHPSPKRSPISKVPPGTRTSSMPVTGSTMKPASTVCASAAQARQPLSPAGMRRPHAGQVSRAPHSGQSFQAAFTSAPHAGQANRASGCPHIGHTFHVSLTGSPQAVHLFFGSIHYAPDRGPQHSCNPAGFQLSSYTISITV